MESLHLGIDDTDSKGGLCTTDLASILVEWLLSKGVIVTDYPNLIRLNPNIPWKTRGNAAVALRLTAEKPDSIFQSLYQIVREYTAPNREANPAVVSLFAHQIPEPLLDLGQRALWDVVRKREALAVAHKCGAEIWLGGDGRGVVGALAAIGNPLEGDHTFELLLYRHRTSWGSKRRVDPASVFRMSRATVPETFNNVDVEKGRLLVTPHGPDPVLLGIRGESPDAVLQAFSYVQVDEPIARYMIVRSNQGTGAHLARQLDARSWCAFRSGLVQGSVVSTPQVGVGGHVYFQLRDGGKVLPCACYEPTGSLTRVAASLVADDYVEVGGGLRRRSQHHSMALNVEQIRLLRLTADHRLVNPVCPRCRDRMVSQGRGQGFRCEACGFRDKYAGKILETRPRLFKEGLYLPPPRSHRHLTKPLQRYGREKRWKPAPLLRTWFGVGRPPQYAEEIRPGAPSSRKVQR